MRRTRTTGPGTGRRPTPPVAVLAAAVLAGGALAACGGDAGGTGGGPTAPEASASLVLPNPLADPAQVPVLARAHLGENPVVRRISLNDTMFRLEVRDPARPENLDAYYFRAGTWSQEPVSVTSREIAELDDVTFTLGAVGWKAVPSLMRQALDGLALEQEEITGVSFDRLAGKPPRVYIGVRGLRGSGRLLADADGTGVEVTRD